MPMFSVSCKHDDFISLLVHMPTFSTLVGSRFVTTHLPETEIALSKPWCTECQKSRYQDSSMKRREAVAKVFDSGHTWAMEQ